MSGVEFVDLPFFQRPDLSPYLIHLTRESIEEDEYSAFDNLENILLEGKIRASSKEKGFIKGPYSATCFMDVPLEALKYILSPQDRRKKPRYEPYGVVIQKPYAYRKGCRPVCYLSNEEIDEIGFSREELWRVVRFEVDDNWNWISWLHEREWRCKGGFRLPKRIGAVLVRDLAECQELQKRLTKNPQKFKTIPKSILPLTVVCQGLKK